MGGCWRALLVFASSRCMKLSNAMPEAYIFQVKYTGVKYLKTSPRFNGKKPRPDLGEIL